MSENQWWETEENNSVATKPKLWRPIKRAIGGFDLDPAAGCEPTPIAEDRYTKEDDGLSQPWYGNVWLNPPFSDKTPWFRRLVDQYWNGDVDRAVALASSDPSADWFHDWFATSDVIYCPPERDLYLAAGNSPSFSTMVGVWNPTDELIPVLQGMGTVVKPVQEDNNAELTDYGENE